jgi:hypothetical protein
MKRPEFQFMAGTSCRPLELGVVVFAWPADDEGSEDLRATVQSARVRVETRRVEVGPGKKVCEG